MDVFKQIRALNQGLAGLTPEERSMLSDIAQTEQEEAIARAEAMRNIYKCCPSHGYPILKIRKAKYDLWESVFEFDNLTCTPLGEPGHYCVVDISNDPELLKLSFSS